MVYTFNALVAVVEMLNAFKSNNHINYNFEYDWVSDTIGSVGNEKRYSYVIREEQVWDGGDDTLHYARHHFHRERIYKITNEELSRFTPNDVMLLYKKLHREEFTCDTMGSRG